MSTLQRLRLLRPIQQYVEMAMPPLCQPIDTRSNRASCVFAYQAWLTIISDNLFNNGLSDDSVFTRLNRFTEEFLCATEPSLVLKCCKVSYDLLLDCISGKSLLTYSDFKDQITTKTSASVNVDAFVAPINRFLTQVLYGKSEYKNGIWANSTSKEVKLLASFFGFLTKLPLTNVILEETALKDYIELEENYPNLVVSNPYLPRLKRLITTWLKDFSYDGGKCKHGKGAVADAKSYPLDKFRHLSSDTRLEYLFKEKYENGFATFAPLGLNGLLERCSKVVFVPKNVSKMRTISMEPASLQYVQQGVMSGLYDYFKVHPYLRNHIQLDDQTVNQSLAYDGSITNKYATIDLSQASDTVSYALVKYLFRSVRPLYRWIVGSRSDYTLLPNGEKIKLKKFAPMGSALCFPIETLIFAAIAKLGVHEAYKAGVLCKDEKGRCINHYTAYGDDIIVPTPAYPYVVKILESFNFTVNDTKSYENSPFKESCGGNFFCGLDVTPIKWKSMLEDNGSIGPEAYESLCSCVNNCSDQGFRITRSFILQRLREENLKPLFTEDRNVSPHVFSTHCTNFHLRQKWLFNSNVRKPNYQKYQFIYDSTSTAQSSQSRATQQDKIDKDRILYYLSLTKQPSVKTRAITGNNMSYNPKSRLLMCDTAQKPSSLYLMDKVTKFSRGTADV